MSGGVPIPRVGGLVEEGSRVALVSSSPDWSNAATPGSLHNSDMKGSWQAGHNMNLRGAHNTMHRRVESLDTEDYSSRFFQGLQVGDPTDRMIALENITELLLAPENERLLRAHVRTLVRLSTECPYEDVMLACQRILTRVEREFDHINIPKPSPGPSRFISNSTIPPITTPDPVVSRIFQDLFLQVGRVTHTHRILALHPAHLKRYYLTFSKIMREPGPLPLHWRNYIAVLSASRFNCSYLSAHQESEFLLNNGDPDWLQGVEHSPKKIQNLISVIAVMAHQPWLLTKEHIEKLVKGHDAWSISELVHAMLLVSTYVSLAGFIFGCGVTPEVDLEEDEIEKESELGIVHSNPYEGGLATGTAVTGGEEGQEKKLGEHVNNSNNSNNSGNREGKRDSASVDTFKLMELLKRGIAEEESKDKAKDFANAGTDGDHANKQLSSSTSGIQQDVSRYKGNIEMSHTDFDVKAKSYSIFLAQEYGWREHGYELLRRFYPDIADLLDEEFTQTYLMTYNTFSTSTHIDTLPFRRAIWYYVQRVKGMCHDDYNYQEVNMLLNRDVKFFVKKLACFPDSITQLDFNDLKLELRPEEKCHVALLAMESHKQACLLYGLHAVMQYMNKY